MLKDMKVGDTIFCNYGAMYPTQTCELIDFDGDLVVCRDPDGLVVNFTYSRIKDYETRSVNGSPIGVFYIPAKKAA